ncbi:Rho termination factor N-terminal domain-containing protein [Micromonospora sp. NPDC051296]|uniref:Rho termination factor N-terminal domain-containing protein n=1 Tax=Micromonospora sp. NPDC051296 TaxID=3155046 RepID=UPI003425FD05
MSSRRDAALARAVELLADLPDADLTALLDGRARIAVVPVAPAPADQLRPARTGRDAPAAERGSPGRDPAVAQAALAAMTSRAEGTAYLSDRPVRELRALAAGLGLRGVGGLRKAELVERIVDGTIGYRLTSTAVRER